MKKYSKNYYKSLVAKNKREEVIDLLMQQSSDYLAIQPDQKVQDVYDDLIVLAGQLDDLKREELLNLIDSEKVDRVESRINHNLVKLVNKLTTNFIKFSNGEAVVMDTIVARASSQRNMPLQRKEVNKTIEYRTSVPAESKKKGIAFYALILLIVFFCTSMLGLYLIEVDQNTYDSMIETAEESFRNENYEVAKIQFEKAEEFGIKNDVQMHDAKVGILKCQEKIDGDKNAN